MERGKQKWMPVITTALVLGVVYTSVLTAERPEVTEGGAAATAKTAGEHAGGAAAAGGATAAVRRESEGSASAPIYDKLYSELNDLSSGDIALDKVELSAAFNGGKDIKTGVKIRKDAIPNLVKWFNEIQKAHDAYLACKEDQIGGAELAKLLRDFAWVMRAGLKQDAGKRDMKAYLLGFIAWRIDQVLKAQGKVMAAAKKPVVDGYASESDKKLIENLHKVIGLVADLSPGQVMNGTHFQAGYNKSATIDGNTVDAAQISKDMPGILSKIESATPETLCLLEKAVSPEVGKTPKPTDQTPSSPGTGGNLAPSPNPTPDPLGAVPGYNPYSFGGGYVAPPANDYQDLANALADLKNDLRDDDDNDREQVIIPPVPSVNSKTATPVIPPAAAIPPPAAPIIPAGGGAPPPPPMPPMIPPPPFIPPPPPPPAPAPQPIGMQTTKEVSNVEEGFIPPPPPPPAPVPMLPPPTDMLAVVRVNGQPVQYDPVTGQPIPMPTGSTPVTQTNPNAGTVTGMVQGVNTTERSVQQTNPNTGVTSSTEAVRGSIGTPSFLQQ